MSKVVTFGEIMLRLSPNGYYRFSQTNQLEATYGGGEANVAVSLANFGLRSVFVSKLPVHAVAKGAESVLKSFGVNTEYIAHGEGRMGIYFLEKGIGERSSVCIYDRDYTAIKLADNADFDWDAIFVGADWFHFTGITPALGANLIHICQTACEAAKKHGVKISCDLNYRSKLWTREEARKAMSQLCRYVDVCICNEEDAKDVFGIQAKGTNIEQGHISREGYREVATALAEQFHFEKVAITLRSSFSASDNDWSGLLYDGKQCYFAKNHHLRIADRVGGGDSFAAGLIYALIQQKSPEECIEFAVAAAALKHTIEGDFNRVTIAEVNALTHGCASGRIQR